MKYKVREAQMSDHKSIVQFQILMAQETEGMRLDLKIVTQGVEAVLSGQVDGKYWVADDEGRVMASLLVLQEWSDWRNGVVWWIHSVYVAPEYRGKKVFKAMYQNLQSLALADPKIRGLRLYVEKHNDRARRVYESLGMSADRYELFEWMKDGK